MIPIEGLDCYHFQRLPSPAGPDAPRQPWQPGQTYTVGHHLNHFSAFFHRRVQGRRQPGGEFRRMVNVSADILGALDQEEPPRRALLRYGYDDLRQVLRGTATALQSQCNLVRELIFEEVRAAEFPNHPSRQTCIWLAPSPRAVQFWDYRIPRRKQWFSVRLLSGQVHLTDAALLTNEYQTIPELRALARRYWSGDVDPHHPQAEMLFEGTLRVLETIRPAGFAAAAPGRAAGGQPGRVPAIRPY